MLTLLHDILISELSFRIFKFFFMFWLGHQIAANFHSVWQLVALIYNSTSKKQPHKQIIEPEIAACYEQMRSRVGLFLSLLSVKLMLY